MAVTFTGGRALERLDRVVDLGDGYVAAWTGIVLIIAASILGLIEAYRLTDPLPTIPERFRQWNGLPEPSEAPAGIGPQDREVYSAGRRGRLETWFVRATMGIGCLGGLVFLILLIWLLADTLFG